MNAKPFDARFNEVFAKCPLIAILRGIEPKDPETIGKTLVEAGFGIIEVPLNSPDPFDSIARLIKRFGHRAIIGAGTVTKSEKIGELARIGAAIAVSPHAASCRYRSRVSFEGRLHPLRQQTNHCPKLDPAPCRCHE